MASHAPFPDVTGLRTSGPGFSRVGEHCEFLHVHLPCELDARTTAAIADGNLDSSILSAWNIILYHYGSHEASNVDVLLISERNEAIMLVDFTDKREAKAFPLSELISLTERQQALATAVSDLDQGYAAFVPRSKLQCEALPAVFQEVQQQKRPELSLVLTYTVVDNRLTLHMKTAASVHSEESALLQLRQVAALLQSFSHDPETHSLALERFDQALRASDNLHYINLPDPHYLEGRHTDRLETEFEHFADTRSDALALDFRFDLQDTHSTKWTYAEMNELAEKVKTLLWSHGVGAADEDKQSDHIVALYLEKSPETYLSFLGVLKAGAAWCPIDTDWPPSRRQALLAKSGAKIVLTHSDRVSKQLQEDLASEDVLKLGGMQAIRLDQLDEELQRVPQMSSVDTSGRSKEQLAYMIWTSGTTGLPKGVGIQHNAIIQAMRALRQYIPHGKQAIGTDEIRYLQYSAYNFDLSIMDCFYTWGLGGTLCSCPRDVLLQDLVDVGNSIKPTHTLLTPAVMAMTERHKVPSLKVVISGGEKLSQVVADEWSKDCCLLNLYGPAEATLIAMNRRVPFGDRVKAPNIGVALPTVSCHALDKADRVVLKGAVGELVLGGPQLARGYVGDPVKTADKFFPHPELGRVYRTGDLVRQLSNQEFEYLGRIDDQVKINGIRIELLEINAAIKNSHDLIKDSETMAFPKPGNDSEQQIINFSVLPGDPKQLLRTDDKAIEVARELQLNARSHLPSYMIPNVFVILSHFPRTSSAKIDRVALKNVLSGFDQLDWENKLAGEDDSDIGQSEGNEAEVALRDVLSELCNVDANKIGRKTPFVSIGLDSIRAMTFSKRLVQQGFPVSVLDVARYPTLLSLGQKLSETHITDDTAQMSEKVFASFDSHYREAVLASLPEMRSKIVKILPCTSLQEGMLAESQRDPMSYRIQRQYALPEDYDQGKLRAALQGAVDRLDCLRTTFVDIGTLDIAAKEPQWPFKAHLLQLVWDQSESQIKELQLEAQDDLSARLLDFCSKELEISPLSVKPPVGFVLAKQAKNHYLIVVAHHSVYDARSLGILEDWLETLYEGSTPPETLQLSTALAHILPMSQEQAQQKQSVWTKALEAYPRGISGPFPPLSTHFSPQSVDKRSLHQSEYIDASVSWDCVQDTCRQLEVSSRPLLQSAWARVLAAYLETEHVIVGDSVSGRNLSSDLDLVFGPVLSTVPVPFLLQRDKTAAQLIKETNSFHNSTLEAQHTDLGAIRKLLELGPGESLFHSVFVLEPAQQESQREVTSFYLQKVADLGVATEHALGVEVLPQTDGSVRLGLSWHKALISEDFGRMLLSQFDESLRTICNSNNSTNLIERRPETESLFSLSTLRDLSAAHSGFVNVVDTIYRGTDAASINAVEIFDNITESANPASPCASISYIELDSSSNQVAAQLRHLPRNSVIGVCLERCLMSYIVPLAILKAGHAYLPLDETLPLSRKKELLTDSDAALLIGNSTTTNAIDICDTMLVDTEDFKKLISTAGHSAPRTTNEPDDVAFIIYTSGSTGKPKGCQLTNQNLSAAIEAFRLMLERHAPGSFENSARFLARSAEAFDVHLLEIFLSFRVGATIVTGPRALVHEDIGLTMRTLNVTHTCVVPSLFYVNGTRIKPSSVPSIRALIIGGEPLTNDVCELWGSECDERPVLLNAYGPSEATIGTSVARISKTSRPSNIGTPFPGTRYLVLKESGGQLVPTIRGEPGELFIGGLQVSKGYLKRPELKPFLLWENEWLYRTGDMVRLHPNDEAEYLGRIDGSQVKVRGARLELGEVDATVTSCLPRVCDKTGSTVTILSDHPALKGAPRLVSFYTISGYRKDQNSGSEPAVITTDEALGMAAELRRMVRSALPAYMVPHLVLPITFIPISTLSGKADRKALETLYKSIDPAHYSSRDDEADRAFTDKEQEVASLIADTARLDPDMTLTPSLDLITAGLDSLSVITLSSRLRKLGFNVSPASLMDQPTIQAIAKSSEEGDVGDKRDYGPYDRSVEALTAKVRSLPALRHLEIETAMPCVPLQVALISQASAEGHSAPRYITTVVLVLQGDFSDEAVQQAWTKSLKRHAIYRTVFTEVDRKLVQAVLAETDYRPHWQSISEDLPVDGKLDFYHQTTAKHIVSTFSSEPPLRLKLWRGTKETALTMTCSHALYDGDSLKMLLEEVSQHLTEPTFESSGTSGPFSLATREIVTQSEENCIAFWKNHLQDFVRTAVPNLSGIRPGRSEGSADEVTIGSKHSYAILQSAARANGITVQAILLEAYCSLLSLYTGEKDVTVGLVLSGRTLPIPDVESIHGPLVTTTPFRLPESEDRSTSNRLRSTHKLINQILPYQHVSLPNLMKTLQIDQAPFEALFSYLGSSMSSSRNVLTEESTIMERDYPLALEVNALDDRVQLHLAFDTKRIPSEQARLMVSQYDDILTRILDSRSSEPTKNLSVLNKDCYEPRDLAETFLARFAGHCKATPNAPAIVFASSMDEEPSIMTYGQLASMSNTIAGHLVRLHEQIVGVHLTKDGPELYAAIVAVWKAGKTYLPLDPTLPKERLQYMVESSGHCPTIATKKTSDNLDDSQCQVLDLETLLTPCNSGTPLPSPRLDVPCYLLFTSGSTGKPKAVQVGQRALAAALYSWERILPFTKASRFLQLASIGFDVSLIELCMPLSLGFSLGTAPKVVLLEDLVTSIKHLGITIADLPAALAGTVHPDDVQLEWLMSGGDVIDTKVIEIWNDAGRKLINAWGPTEATIGNTLGEIKRDSTRNMIGKPYPTSSMYVLDESSPTIMPYGAIGELAVGGPQVADMYYGREDLTAEKFIKLEDGSRVYRTGDLGRFLYDGSVECLGRIGSDRQVKINGQRMELDEVSAVLSAQSGVQDADVQYLKHPTMASKQLVAFVAQKGAATAAGPLVARTDDDAVEMTLRLEGESVKRLAAYMIPTHWIVTSNALPLSHNNKTDHKALANFFESIDAKALRDFGSKREGSMSTSVWTESEKKLRGILADFCNIAEEDIAKTTSFHRLGIDSITAIHLVKKLRQSGFVLTVAELMSTPYIAALAEKGQSSCDTSGAAVTSEDWRSFTEQLSSQNDIDAWKLTSVDAIESVVPCTPLQTGMIAQTLARSGKLYFHHHGFEVENTVEEVTKAWKEVVTRLDILRTTFHASDGEYPWLQAVHSDWTPAVVIHSGRFDPMLELETISGQPNFQSEEAFSDPPHALHLWQQGKGTALLLSIHHALYDGSSLPQLLDDFATVLSQNGVKSPERLPFHHLAPSLLSSDSDVEHWVKQLDKYCPTLLQKSTAANEVAVLAERTLSLSVTDIETKCRPLGVSLQVLCCLAFAKLLALEAGSRDICFGQLFGLLDVVADADTVVGPAFNTVATRVCFDYLDNSNTDMLLQLQKANDTGRSHRKAALRDVQAKLKQGPLFDALFDYQRDHGQAEDSILKPIKLSDDGDAGTQYTLNVAVVQGPSKISVVAKAVSSKYDELKLASLVEQLEQILLSVLDGLDEPVSRLSGVDNREFPKSLPSVRMSQNGHHASSGTPLTDDGCKLASIISEVSGTPIDQIGGDTRLIKLGLDSISAIKIASQARRAGLKLGMGQVVSGETINDILSSEAPAKNGVAKTMKLDPKVASRVKDELGYEASQIERVLPLLSGQLFWLATWTQTNGAGGYSFAFRLPSASASKVQSAWTALRQQQPILRTAFLLSAHSTPQQVVLTAETVKADACFEAIEPGHDEKATVKKAVAAQAALGWSDLSQPPLKLTLIGEVLVFSLHHVLYDAFSVDFLVRDFASLYQGGELISSPKWIEAVDHVSSAQNASRSESHWKKALQNCSPGILPYVKAGEDGENFSFEPQAVALPSGLDAKLRKVQISLPSLIVAAWSSVLSDRMSKQGTTSRPLFGMFHLGRSSAFDAIESVHGPLLSVLPMAVPITPGDATSLIDGARSAAEELRARAAYEQSNLAQVHKWSGLSTERPSYNTFLNLLISSSDDSSRADNNTVPSLKPIELGHPSNLPAPTPSSTSSRYAKDVQTYANIMQPDVNVDIVLDPASDYIAIGIKAKSSVVPSEDLPQLMQDFVAKINLALSCL